MQANSMEVPQRSIIRKFGQASLKGAVPNELATAPPMMSPGKRRNSVEPIGATSMPSLKPKKRLQLSNDMQCKLKISRLTKAVFAQYFSTEFLDGDRAAIKCYGSHRGRGRSQCWRQGHYGARSRR